jgi:hypothetical protein
MKQTHIDRVERPAAASALNGLYSRQRVTIGSSNIVNACWQAIASITEKLSKLRIFRLPTGRR